MSGGLKYDQGKPRMELLSTLAVVELSKVLSYGAKKYTTETDSGDHNWRKGMKWSRLAGAALRHIFAWLAGETVDPETGINHLAHAMCCLMFLLEYQEIHKALDDRYKP